MRWGVVLVSWFEFKGFASSSLVVAVSHSIEKRLVIVIKNLGCEGFDARILFHLGWKSGINLF